MAPKGTWHPSVQAFPAAAGDSCAPPHCFLHLWSSASLLLLETPIFHKLESSGLQRQHKSSSRTHRSRKTNYFKTNLHRNLGSEEHPKSSLPLCAGLQPGCQPRSGQALNPLSMGGTAQGVSAPGQHCFPMRDFYIQPEPPMSHRPARWGGVGLCLYTHLSCVCNRFLADHQLLRAVQGFLPTVGTICS